MNSQFKLDNIKNNQIEFIENDEINNDIIQVKYEKKCEFNNEFIGFFDFNEYLLALYSTNSLHLITKKNFVSKIDIIKN